METMLVRLKPYDTRRGHVLRRYTYAGIKFHDERGWYRVEKGVAEYLRGVHQVPGNEVTPLAFDVCTEEDAKALETREESDARVRRSATDAVPLTAARPEAVEGALTTAAWPSRQRGRWTPGRSEGEVYAAVADLRAEGVTVSAASDARLALLVDEATALIDRVTGQFFEPRTRTVRVDGRGGPTVELPVPPLRLARVQVEYEGCAGGPTLAPFPFAPGAAFDLPLDTSTMAVRGAPVGPGFDGGRITLRHGLRFPRGHANVVVDGVWGFTEDDGTPEGRTPLAIRRACMLLVLRSLAPLADDASVEARTRWRLVEERTRDQSYRLDAAKPSGPVLTGEPEVDALLAAYVRPSPIGAA